ncbi:hypothetical protein Agabi119p4_71 [Agaricus bisporus var. burnettii]|uniref:Uncharacterized protein n=1 Tax=Agaricus bisporus var. burnettii TaxID=192524 RepID=A0A8H7FA28_AGABI|nr:hypothetical protein Agabi119p4_71 [Agaricus bisporus var. burnettii]
MSGPTLPPFLLPQAISITFVGGISIGVYLISAAFANRWLIFTDDGWRFRSPKSIHWCILAITNTLVVLILIGQALNVNTSIAEADLVEQGHQLSEYEDPNWKPIVKCMVSGVITLLADTVLMYRLWVTDQKRMRSLWFPIFLWLSGVVCNAIELFLQVKSLHDPNYGPYKWASVNMKVGPGIAIIPFVASTILLNAYCTGHLIWRIRRVLKLDTNSSGARQLQMLTRILMESGILYLSISIAHFVAYFCYDTFAIHMIGTLHTIVIGIAYNLIIIRVGQARSEDECNLSEGTLTTFQVAQNPSQGIPLGATDSVMTVETAEFARDKPLSLVRS